MVAPALATQAISFVAQIGASYLLGRWSAQDGPKLGNLDAASGDYGVPMPRLYGSAVRTTGVFMAQDEIEETKHKVQDHSEIVGAVSGAAQGFLIGGPVGAVVGGVLGGLFGAVTPDQKYYTYADTFALLLADRQDDDPIEDVLKLWANGRIIFNADEQAPVSEVLDGTDLVSRTYGPNRYFKSLTIYGGGVVQTADPVLVAALGTQPGYRNTAYVVIEDLQLASFGNSVPPCEALVQAKTDQSLADVADAICAAAGIDPEHNLSSTALTGQVIRGYAITSEATCWDALSPLMPVYKVDAGEVAGQVRFYQREQGLRATIPLEDMGGHEYGSDPGPRVNYARTSDLSLPRETTLTFIDPARDYQANTATSRRSEGDARSNVATSMALTLTAEEGAEAVATLHWNAWLGRTANSFTLTDKWLGLTPGKAFGIPFGDDVLPYRVTRKLRGANGIIEVEVLSDENVTYQGTVPIGSGEVVEDSTALAETRVVLMDMPILEDLHDDFGYYAIMGATAPYWERGRIEASPDAVTYGILLDYPGSAIMGDVVGTLAEGATTGLDDTLDTTSVLTVTLLHSEMVLESATDADLDLFRNFAFVGKDGQGEYLQFKTATQITSTQWELTDLRRGRKGTDWALGEHVSGEEFVLLGGSGVFRLPYLDDTGWGTELVYRGVTLHQDPDTADTVLFTNTGEGKRPYSPVNFEGVFDGGFDLDLTWDRRSRFNDGTLGTDAPEAYELDVYNGAAFVKTIDAVSESYTYTNADQVTDGFTEGDAITIELFQVNTDYGRSRARRGAFLPPAFTWHMEDDTTPIHMEDDFTPIGLG